MKKITYQPEQESEEFMAAKKVINEELEKQAIKKNKQIQNKTIKANNIRTDQHNVPVNRPSIFSIITKGFESLIVKFKTLSYKKKLAIGVAVFPLIFALIVLAKPILFNGHLPFSSAEQAAPTEAQANAVARATFTDPNEGKILITSNTFGTHNFMLQTENYAGYIRHPFSAKPSYRLNNLAPSASGTFDLKEQTSVDCEKIQGGDWVNVDKSICDRHGESGSSDIVYTLGNVNGISYPQGDYRYMRTDMYYEPRDGARKDGDNRPSMQSWQIPKLEEYKKYAKAVYSRYYGKVNVIEVWNEPDYYFAGTPDYLAAMTIRAREAVDEVYLNKQAGGTPEEKKIPKAKLLGPGFTPQVMKNENDLGFRGKYMRDYFISLSERTDTTSAKEDFPLDAVGIHGYADVSANETDPYVAVAGSLKSRSTVLAAFREKVVEPVVNVYKDKIKFDFNYWDTEWNLRKANADAGSSNGYKFEDTRKTANALAKTSLAAFHYGYTRQYSFIWSTEVRSSEAPKIPSAFHESSVLLTKGTPYSRTVFANLSALLDQSTYRGRIVSNEYNADYDIYKFQKNTTGTVESKIFSKNQYITIRRTDQYPNIYIWVPQQSDAMTYVSIDGFKSAVVGADGSPIHGDNPNEVGSTVIQLFPSDLYPDPYCAISYKQAYHFSFTYALPNGQRDETRNVPVGKPFPSTNTFGCLPDKIATSDVIDMPFASFSTKPSAVINGGVANFGVNVTNLGAHIANKVEFLINGTVKNTINLAGKKPPYLWQWDTSVVSDGNYKVVARIHSQGKTDPVNASRDITTEVRVDKTAPTTYITSPISNETVHDTIEVVANVSDTAGSGIKKVDFYLDGVGPKKTILAAPYTWSLDTNSLAAGAHVIKVVATDNAGNQGIITRTIKVDNTVPSLTISSPTANSVVSGTVTVQAKVTDASSITRVDYLVDNVVKKSFASATYSWSFDSKAYSDGTHKVSVRAYDSENNMKEASVTLTINNTTTYYKPGDINKDNKVNITDLSYLISKWGTSDPAADINNDNKVSIIDLSIVISDWGP